LEENFDEDSREPAAMECSAIRLAAAVVVHGQQVPADLDAYVAATLSSV
jgi:hypothetical protein